MTTTLLQQHPDVVDAEVDDERVLLHCTTGVYYGLNPVGSYLWPLLATPTSVDELAQRVADHFDVAADICRPDVEAFLAHLSENGLLAA